MKNLPTLVSRPFTFAALAAALLAGMPAARAATFTWGGETGLWDDATKWVGGVAPPSDPATDLIFPGVGADAYLSENTVFGFTLNTLTLNSTATVQNIIGGDSLEFVLEDVPAAILQNNSGEFRIDNFITVTDQLTLGGTGAGLVTLSGMIDGGGGLNVASGNWRLTNAFNTFTGGVTVNTGAVLDVAPGEFSPQSVNIAPGFSSSLGGNSAPNPLVIDGGTLKLTTKGSGNITFGDNRPLTFGVNGGVLDLRNNNLDSPGSAGGNMAGGANDLALTLNNTGGSVAVIKWNGGEVGVSSNNPLNGDWAAGNNVLRIESYAGAGPLRIEVTNGGAWSNRAATINVPITVRGVTGGDPTSGPDAAVNANLHRDTGRMFVDVQGTANYTQGILFEDAVQVSVTGTARALDGNMTIAGTAGGNAGYIVFNGRATGTALGPILRPAGHGGTGDAGQYPLYIGVGGNDTLTIQDGGVAVFDNRIRHDQANNNGVLLNARAVIQAGGELRLNQSLSGVTASAATAAGTQSNANANANVGHHIFDGNIQGEGTTAKDAIFNIHLPSAGSTDAAGVPNTFTQYGGVAFRNSSNLVINGTGFGGLRVNAKPRSAGIFADGIDPVSNLDKINNLLTPARINAVTGTGGYLTIVPEGQTYVFPNGEWAAAQPVGLKVLNHTTGVDLEFALDKRTWSHNLAVEAGAEVNTGLSLFTMNAGTLHGTGTVGGAGGLTIASEASISPGFGGIGTLTLGNVTLNGSLVVDATSAGAIDVLNIGGNITLGSSSALRIAPGSTLNNQPYTFLTYDGTLSGTFGAVSNAPLGYSVSYDTDGEVRLVFTPVATRVWEGAPGAVWSTNAADANWKSGAAFVDGTEAIFDDTAAGSRTVTISGTVQPAGVTVNTATQYTIIGSANDRISGAGALTKSGTGVLELHGAHTYGDGTTVNAGTLRLGTNDVLPNSGRVRIAAGATFDVNAKNDAIGELSVGGTVTGGNLTVASLVLDGAGTVGTNLTLNGNVSKTGEGSTTITGAINLGGGVRIFDIADGGSPDLTIGGLITNGGLTKAGGGVLLLNVANTYTGGTTVNGGTLRAGVAQALPAGTLAVNTGGTLDLNGFNHTFQTVSGSGGAIELGAGTMTIETLANSTFAGAINGPGSVVKNGVPVQTLSGSSTFTGGLTINAGRVNLIATTAAGAGPVTLNSGATLQLGATVPNAITVDGGVISSQSGASLQNGELTFASASEVHTFNKDTNANTEVIFTGTLRGSGDVTIVPGPNQANADQGAALRLRGTTTSDYSGTMIALQRVKFEIQVANAASPNPFGAGKLVMHGGTSTGGLQGTYTQLQPRLNSAGLFYPFGNDIEIEGTGYTNFNMLGSADVTAQFGDLRIGEGQIFGASKNDAAMRTIGFDTVTLTSGMAEFRAFDPAFAVQTNATRGGANISLGVISEIVAGAGIILKAAAPHMNIIEGESTFTGPTIVDSGVLRVSAGGSLASSSEIFLGQTARLDLFSRFDAYVIPTAQKLSGSGGWDGRLELDGTLEPGPGLALMAGSDFVLHGGATMKFGLSTFDNSSDQLQLFSFEKGTPGAFRFDFEGGGQEGQTYTLVSFFSTNFEADDFSLTNLAPGLSGTFELTGTDLLLVVIPEPGALLSLFAGAGVLLGLRRPRRS